MRHDSVSFHILDPNGRPSVVQHPSHLRAMGPPLRVRGVPSEGGLEQVRAPPLDRRERKGRVVAAHHSAPRLAPEGQKGAPGVSQKGGLLRAEPIVLQLIERRELAADTQRQSLLFEQFLKQGLGRRLTSHAVPLDLAVLTIFLQPCGLFWRLEGTWYGCLLQIPARTPLVYIKLPFDYMLSPELK